LQNVIFPLLKITRSSFGTVGLNLSFRKA
jgi:hypothetical protein